MMNEKVKLAEHIFDLAKIEQKPTRMGFGEGLVLAGDENKNVVALCADLTESTQMHHFQKKYPDRFIEIGVAEQNLASVASGMAAMGKVPFISSYAMFSPGRNWEQIRTTICYNDRKVVIAGSHAGVSVGPDGATHQAIEDMAITRVIPNMTVLAPCDPEEAKYLTQWCARHNQGPVYLRLGKTGEPNYTINAVDPFVFGKLRYICKGKEVCIITYGPTGIKIAFDLKDNYLSHQSVSIVSCHTIKPLDWEGLQSLLANHAQVIVIEEHVPHGGLSSRIKEFAWDNNVSCDLLCFTLKDHFFHYYGTHDGLLRQHELTADVISQKLKRICS